MPSKKYYQAHKEEMTKKYTCIELGCNKKIWYRNSRCRKHAEKYKIYPSRKGKNNNQFKDGRSLKKHCCIDCGNEIGWYCAFYGTGRCRSCAAKHRLKNPKNHPMFGKSRNDLRVKFKGEGNPRFGKTHTKETKKRFAEQRKGKLNGMFGKHHTEKTKEKIRQRIVASLKAGKYNIKPNKPEKLLNKILQILLPKEYKYVGNFKFWIDCYNPDFINCNGQKKVIELFGDYWHNRKDAKKRDVLRLKAYKKYGYKTLIVWEHELKNLNKVKLRIKRFSQM
ncbi:hypothetical protein LCGC14_1279690 [marine sediment metagenome]|uniref:Nuclease associated modular domain-containing protein n=1 Tax=marine sediment metagenome TaxID=412755 RepID=A0A0F9KXE6_9ZZZZ